MGVGVDAFGAAHQLPHLTGIGRLPVPVPDVEDTNRFRLSMNGEEDLVAAVSFPLEEEPHLGLKILRLVRKRTPARHLPTSTNPIDDPIEPALSAFQASVLADIVRD